VAVAHGGSVVVPESDLQWQARRRTAGALPPRTTSLEHSVSMDPAASGQDDVAQQKRRRTDAGGSAAVTPRHRRRGHGEKGQGILVCLLFRYFTGSLVWAAFHTLTRASFPPLADIGVLSAQAVCRLFLISYLAARVGLKVNQSINHRTSMTALYFIG